MCLRAVLALTPSSRAISLFEFRSASIVATRASARRGARTIGRAVEIVLQIQIGNVMDRDAEFFAGDFDLALHIAILQVHEGHAGCR